MVRIWWGVAAAALLGMTAGALLLILQPKPKQILDFGPGLVDAAHLAAADAVLAALPTPPGTTRDPYDTACRAPTPLCFSSQLPNKTLLAEARPLLEAGGARWLAQDCPVTDEQTLAPCAALYDVKGAHILAIAGPPGMTTPTSPTSLSFQDGRPAQQPVSTGGPQPVSPPGRPLGSWASVNPLPAAWHLAASCSKPSVSGCNAYRTEVTKPTPIASGLTPAFATAQESLRAAGFRIDQAICYPATSVKMGHCLVAGSRFRTLDGHDGELAVVALKTVDAGHVNAIVDISAQT